MGTASSGSAAASDDLPALTEIERKVLEYIERAALHERELESNEDIGHALGFSGTGTVRGIVLRLERKRYITSQSYQRGRRVYSARIDKWTKPPMCIVPHWRTILTLSRDTPSLPVTRVMEFPTVMAEVNRLQRERNLDFAGAQLVLMSYGVSMLGFVRGQEGGDRQYA